MYLLAVTIVPAFCQSVGYVKGTCTAVPNCDALGDYLLLTCAPLCPAHASTFPLMYRSCTGTCLRRSMHQRSASSKKRLTLSKGTRGKRTSSKLPILGKLSPHQHADLHATSHDSIKLQSSLADQLRGARLLLSSLHPHPVVKCSLVGLQPLHLPAFIHLLTLKAYSPAASWTCPCATARHIQSAGCCTRTCPGRCWAV